MGDAERLDVPDERSDAVFDSRTSTTSTDRRTALREVDRVPRPGGRFCFEEAPKHAVDRPTYRALFHHPAEDQFTGDEFVASLEDVDLRTGDRHRTLIAGDFILGVAEHLR